MTTTAVQPVILCGGSGARLWPLSRAGFPKQFLCLTGTESLFQQATKRLMGLANGEMRNANPYIVCNEEHRFLVQEQLREINVTSDKLILEPVGRNTAPALTLAAMAAIESGGDPVLVVTPADHAFTSEPAFHNALKQAIRIAAGDEIAILGVVPTKPDTGYGYIHAVQTTEPNSPGLTVKQFVEKPEAQMARAYLDAGSYYWNAGIFVLKASVWMRALKTFRPDIADSTVTSWAQKSQDGAFWRPDKDMFGCVPSESVDYAVIEECPESIFTIKMVPLNAGWSDLGAWDAVWNLLPKDNNGNAHLGDVLSVDNSNTLVHANSRLVSLVGVKDLVVIETPDAVLIADKARSQDVKHIVNQLHASGRLEHVLHRKIHRPWGWYDNLDADERFKVKRIQVNPKASLSLQKHHHRAEHWVVVKGTAEVTNGDKVTLLSENQSTYIPLGEIHRLANPGAIPLEIIEIQSGSYLEEDDIVRFEDNYGRSE